VRLVYLNADRGIPLLGAKGASVHVRASLRAFAPCVDGLTAVCARIDAKKPPHADPSRVPARLVGPFGKGDGLEGALVANDEAAAHLDELYRTGSLDVLYERLSLWSVAGAEAARRLDVPWFVEANAPLAREAATHRDLRGRSVAFFLQQSLLERATGVIVVSEELRQWALESGVDDERILVAPNGCDPWFLPPSAADATHCPFTVAFVGTLKPWHGLDVLIDAFLAFHGAHPDSRLLVIGDGPTGDTVRARLDGALPASAWTMTGALAHRDVAGQLRSAHVAVAPYPDLPDFYFSPLKMLEYSAAGLPVVASRIGQIADTWTDGEDALLVEPGDARALAGALDRLARDPALRSRLGAGARVLAGQRSWQAVTQRIVDWMETRIDATRRTSAAGAVR